MIYLDSGLEITDADSINEKREDNFVKQMESDSYEKAPILSQYRMINKGGERAPQAS